MWTELGVHPQSTDKIFCFIHPKQKARITNIIHPWGFHSSTGWVPGDLVGGFKLLSLRLSLGLGFKVSWFGLCVLGGGLCVLGLWFSRAGEVREEIPHSKRCYQIFSGLVAEISGARVSNGSVVATRGGARNGRRESRLGCNHSTARKRSDWTQGL
jgi:hypothetical protein